MEQTIQSCSDEVFLAFCANELNISYETFEITILGSGILIHSS